LKIPRSSAAGSFIDGKILLIGVSYRCNTTLHTVEDTNGATTRTVDIFYPKAIYYEGKVITISIYLIFQGFYRIFKK